MGICASCLAWDKEDDDDSINPLLFDDPTHTNYGSVGSLADHTPPASTAADQRNDKELENIVALASQKLIPIYDRPEGRNGTRSPYRDLVNKLSDGDLREEDGEDDWASDGESEGEGETEGVSYADVVKGRPDVGRCTTMLKRWGGKGNGKGRSGDNDCGPVM